MQLHFVQVLPDLAAGVVTRAVEEDVGVLFPAGPFIIQFGYQVLQERKHYVLVRIRLREGEVRLAIQVQGRDQRQPRSDRVQGRRGRRVRWAPNLPEVGTLVDPGFINVYDVLLLLEELDHFQAVTLPEHKTSLAVALDGDLLRHSIAEAQVSSEHAANLLALDLKFGELVHADHDALRVRDRNALLQHLLGLRLDRRSGSALPFPLLLQLLQLLRLGLRLLHEPEDQLRRDPEALGDVLLQLMLFDVEADDLLSDIWRQLLQASLLVLPGQASLSPSHEQELSLPQAVHVMLRLGLGVLLLLTGNAAELIIILRKLSRLLVDCLPDLNQLSRQIQHPLLVQLVLVEGDRRVFLLEGERVEERL